MSQPPAEPGTEAGDRSRDRVLGAGDAPSAGAGRPGSSAGTPAWLQTGKRPTRDTAVEAERQRPAKAGTATALEWAPPPVRSGAAGPVQEVGLTERVQTVRPGKSGKTGKPAKPGRPAPRRARLVLRRIDPWSVLKFSLVFSICGVIVGVLAVSILYQVVSGLGVFDSVSKFLDSVTDAQPGSSTRQDFRGGLIIGGAAALLGVGALLFTALATLGAFIYNLCASLTGGLEVTLSERK